MSVDLLSVNWEQDAVNKLVDRAKQIEAALSEYYVDSIEIDLGWALGIQATGKLTIKHKPIAPSPMP